LDEPRRLRDRIAMAFERFEDVIYVGLGLLLAFGAGALLILAVLTVFRSVGQIAGQAMVLDLLDRSLLILMFVELLYTVQVSFRSHVLRPEPFLVVGLIAAVRRILVVTAEFAHMMEKSDAVFHRAMLEVGLLTLMVMALVFGLWLLRRSQASESESGLAPRISEIERRDA
jgi:phosphate starvation-inducible membrane PsiE